MPYAEDRIELLERHDDAGLVGESDAARPT
jgi:hypothetical protein